jgi:hypothetical protein
VWGGKAIDYRAVVVQVSATYSPSFNDMATIRRLAPGNYVGRRHYRIESSEFSRVPSTFEAPPFARQRRGFGDVFREPLVLHSEASPSEFTDNCSPEGCRR